MIKNKFFLTILFTLILSTQALAIPNSQEYQDCMQKESSDAGTAQCYENEIKYFQNMTDENIPLMKKHPELGIIANSQQYNIDEQYKAFNAFLKDYCKYYVKAKQGEGYSDRYLLADCQLGYIQMYAGYLKGLFVKASDSCGEE